MIGNPEKPNVRWSTELKGHSAAVEKVAFNPVKDAELCSVSNDGVVKLWDVRTKSCVNEVKGLGSTHSLAWAPDGSSILVGNRVSFGGLTIWLLCCYTDIVFYRVVNFSNYRLHICP